MRFQFHLQSIVSFAFAFLIFGNLWIALMSLAALWQASLLLHLAVPEELYQLSFSATFAYYNLDRLIEKKPAGVLIQNRHIWLKKYAKALFTLSIGSGLWAGYVLYSLPVLVQLLLCGLVVIAILYSIALPLGKKKWSLKQTGLLKPLLIAFVWTCMSFTLLLVYHESNILIHWPLFIGYGGFITALCLPFDYRDRFIDNKNSMATLGRTGTPRGITGVIGIFLSMQLLLLLFTSHYQLAVFLLPVQLLSSYVCSKSMQHEKEWMYSFGIDGLILGQALFCWLYINSLQF